MVPSPGLTKFAARIGPVNAFASYFDGVHRAAGSIDAAMRSGAVHDFIHAPPYRYLAIEKAPRIVDFRHLFAAASEAHNGAQSAEAFGEGAAVEAPRASGQGTTMLLGVAQELNQCTGLLAQKEVSSCFAAEDLGSKRIGADFGRYVTIKQSEATRATLGQLLKSYLAPYRPKSPDSLPDINMPGPASQVGEMFTAIATGIVDLLVPSAY